MIKQEFNIVHCINLFSRPERREGFLKEAEAQNFGVIFWEGEVVKSNPKIGICRSHKRIIQYAKDNNLEKICVAEDDARAMAPGAWKYFVDNIPKEPWDLYSSMFYCCDVVEGNRIMAPFSGLTLYFVHRNFYDFYLSLPDDCHLDRELGKHAQDYKIFFAEEICFEQDGSRSDNTKTTVGLQGYRSFLKGRKIFGDVEL
jgi:hypothetical protein